jgi:hypothetical protein
MITNNAFVVIYSILKIEEFYKDENNMVFGIASIIPLAG